MDKEKIIDDLLKESDRLKKQVEALAAENKKLIDCASFYRDGFSPRNGSFGIEYDPTDKLLDDCGNIAIEALKSPATDAELAEIRAQARAEGIYFTANRLLAAWDAGFIDSPDKEVIDVARMILSAAEMLPDAVEGDFSREFADEMMGEITKNLRKEAGNEQ